MRRSQLLLSLGLLTSLLGCHHETYYAPIAPPPPGYVEPTPPLIALGERNGYRAGYDDGSRDAYYHAGYAPRRTPAYANAPGYDYRLGPIPPYVDAFRSAYLRGYEQGFHRAG